MKGIVLAGGNGTRLEPITIGTSKQLLPIYDKPMVTYPIATLLASGIRELLIITTPRDEKSYRRLLGDGSKLGISIRYEQQISPDGLACAFLIGADFIAGSKCALILGDNFFHGTGLGRELQKYNEVDGAQIFGYSVSNPSEYGVVEISENGKILSIEEKPRNPKSSCAIPGLYFYDEDVVEIAKSIKPSQRGELEITSVNEMYLRLNKLRAAILPRGTAWFDTGSFESLHDASSYVRVLQIRQGVIVASLDEICWRQGWITDAQLHKNASTYNNLKIRNYLQSLIR